MSDTAADAGQRGDANVGRGGSAGSGGPPRRFRFHYGFWGWLLWLMGMGPRRSSVDIDTDTLHVRMGWAFDAAIPHASISNLRPGTGRWGIGAHGIGGRWLVNGSMRDAVWMDVDPPVRGRTMRIPIKVRELGLGVDDREGLTELLSRRRPHP